MDFSYDIINFIKSNRVSTTEVADALGKKGVLKNILPINSEQFRVGRVRCIFACNSSNYAVHEQIKDAQKDDIIVIFTHDCEDRAILGDLVAKFLLLYKRVEAVVVQGKVRDVGALKRERYAVWSTGVNPIGCFNTPTENFPAELRRQILSKYEGAIAICDDGGVVVIERDLHTAEMLEKLHRIEMQEDLWFFCLDTLKWDTKKIVCDKAYLHESEILPKVFQDNIIQLNTPLDKV